MKLATLAHRVVLASGWRRRLIALGAGALSAFAMAPYDLWPLLILTFPVLIWLIDGAGAGTAGVRSAFGAGWWFGFGYFFAGLYWIGMALLVEADQFGWLLPFAVIAIPAGLALFPALGAAISRLMWTSGPSRLFAFAVGFGTTEWLRGHMLTGFPWNSYGYALAAMPVIAQTAAFVGLWGLTFLTLVTLASPAVLADGREATSRPWLAPLLAALTLVVLALIGAHRLATIEVGRVEGVRLRIMQPNLPQDEKFRTSAKQAVMDRYISLSDRATGADTRGIRDVTHLFWPESAFPFFLEREADALARIADLLPPGVVLVTGAVRLEEARSGEHEPKVYNSIRVIGDDGAILATSDKVHLVPFGEFLPFQSFLERLGFEQITRVRGGFTPGSGRRALAIPRLPPAAPLICYEVIFPGQVLPEAKRPAWLLNVTNDAWFGNTPGPHQHFAQARLRTIEEGLPLVRAANNGISAVVDPLGRIVRALPLGQDGVIDSILPMPIEPTLYARFGDGPVLVLALLFIMLVLIVRRSNKRSS